MALLVFVSRSLLNNSLPPRGTGQAKKDKLLNSEARTDTAKAEEPTQTQDPPAPTLSNRATAYCFEGWHKKSSRLDRSL